LTDSQVWTRSTHLAFVDSPGRVVVLDLSEPATAHPFVMEGTAEAIWRALDEPGTTEEVVSRVAREFGAPPAHVAGDVVDFLADLRARRLVVLADSPRP
jgi:hypothetical protein